jgi:hypothetical protein
VRRQHDGLLRPNQRYVLSSLSLISSVLLSRYFAHFPRCLYPCPFASCVIVPHHLHLRFRNHYFIVIIIIIIIFYFLHYYPHSQPPTTSSRHLRVQQSPHCIGRHGAAAGQDGRLQLLHPLPAAVAGHLHPLRLRADRGGLDTLRPCPCLCPYLCPCLCLCSASWYLWYMCRYSRHRCRSRDRDKGRGSIHRGTSLQLSPSCLLQHCTYCKLQFYSK